jgi:hypothetical protein
MVIALFFFLSFPLIPSTAQSAMIEIFPGQSFETAAENLHPGDTLIVHQGTYTDSGRISIAVKGTAGSPVVIKKADGEARPVITRPDIAPLQNTINIEGATYLTVRGLEIVGNGGDGINLNSDLSFITLEDLDIHDVDVGVNFRSSMNNIIVRRTHIYRTGRDSGTGEGMYVGCNNASCIVRDSVIENNWIHDVLSGTSQGDGIEIKVGSHSNIVRNNVIYNRPYPGILAYGGGNGVNIIEGNVVWNCLEGISALSDAIVRNNIVFSSPAGILSYGHVQVPAIRNLTIVNNTLYNNGEGIYIRWTDGEVANMTLANNAIYSPGKTAVNSGSGLPRTGITAGANYVEGSTGVDTIDNAAFFSGGSSLDTFVDAPHDNFWPSASSRLKGNAIPSLSPANDFNEVSRTSPYDVGAYESEIYSENPGWKISSGFKAEAARPQPPTDLRVQ